VSGSHALAETPGVDGRPPAPSAKAHSSVWGAALDDLRHDRRAIVGGTILLVVVLLTLSAPLISRYVVHHGPNDQFLVEATDQFGLPKGPSREFWFGADRLGRDVFVRVLYGARTSLIVAVLATALAIVLAVSTGMIAGYFGGAVDSFVSRLTDVALCLPALLLAVGLVTACSLGCLGGLIKPGIPLLVFVLGMSGWMIGSRIIRAQALSLRERDFIAASQTQRASAWSILTRDVLPNLTVQVIVLITIEFPLNVLGEAGLSFLGVGVPPDIPSWGKMLEDANQLMTTAWWLMVFPGLFLFATTISFNILGEAIRNTLDPRGTSSTTVR
jgi:peptide/nickel transport system permease protein